MIITSPGDGDGVQPGFVVQVTASDNFEVRNVTLEIGDVVVGTDSSPPYEFITPPIADGPHFVKATASDGKNQASYTTYVVVRAETPAPPPREDTGCAATSGGGAGFALAAMLLGLRRRRKRASLPAH